MEKMTNVKALAFVLANCDLPVEVAEKLEKMKAQTEKHNASKSTKPSKKQSENETLKEAILADMEVGHAYTVGEMVKTLPSCDGLSSQKVSAMVNQLADADLVKKTSEKRTSYFTR